jgi:tRNA dimethylallyltransferase
MKPILIVGPTASGKSALALELAGRHRGVVVNADSMQVYRELSVLTARPGLDDLARAPHRLYGNVPARDAYSVARWLGDVGSELKDIEQSGRRAVIVGGTGLYFKALTEGLSPIPEIPAEIRAQWRTRAVREGAAQLHLVLSQRDPEMARRLQQTDTQRLTRALEVLEATGRSLAHWQAVPGVPLLALQATIPVVIDLPRAMLHARCDRRFDAMVEAGAADEVRGLLGLGIDQSLPVFGALGVAAIAEWIQGRSTREAAVEAGKVQTRQYVKRQQTWIKRYINSWITVQSNEYCDFRSKIDHLIDD